MKLVAIIVGVLVVVGAILFFLKGEQFDVALPLLQEPQLAADSTEVQEIQKQVSAPPPLKLPQQQVSQALLTRVGVINWTNTNRALQGLPSLAEQINLNAAASLKLQDMLQKQYFAHLSPSGEGPDAWVKLAGYDYIAIGENLALGDFKDDEDLLKAWMASPGHRANILNTRFREIGVAVGKGSFEGRVTWLAVQVFGTPLATCPEPSATLMSQIKANEVQLDSWQVELATLREEIERTPKRSAGYNQKVEEYNALVAQYNNLIEQTKALIATYNEQVQAFNICLANV